MDNIFGIPMQSIMLALLIAFGLCLGVGGWIYLRQRIIFRMGIRNARRRPAQTSLIVIGLMLSTLIIAAALTTGDTLNYSIKSTVLDVLQHTDELVVPVNGDDAEPDAQQGVTFPQQVAADLQNALADDPVIDGLMPVLAQPVPILNPQTQLSEPIVTAVGIDPAALEPFGGLRDLDGNDIDLTALPEGAVVLGKTAAERIDAVVGDTLTVYIKNQPRDITVAAIAPDSILTGMHDLGQAGGFVMTLDRAQELLELPGQISFIAVSNAGGVDDGVEATDEAVSAIDAALGDAPYGAVRVKQRALNTAEEGASVFTSIFLVLGLFSIAAGILLIFLIFVVLAAERKPEMGMARAVGMKRRQLTEMFLAEGIAYDLVSALIGSALGVGVAFVIAGVMGRLVGDFFTIVPTAHWRSLVVAYSLGVVVTFVTIAISSWRVSRLNIVRAIRDIPEPQRQRAGNRWLIFGILGVVLGALLMWVGADSDKLFPYSIGISVLPLSLAAALRRFGLPARLLYTVASLVVLAFWLLPDSIYKKIFPDLSGGMEMFFVSGIMIVAAATMAIVWNAEIATTLVRLFGRTFSRWLPAVKTAVAYPLASKGRTGMTIAMFSLIVFSLVMMATIDHNFTRLFSGEEAAAGWDIAAARVMNDPMPPFDQALAESGVDTSRVTATGRVRQVASYDSQIRLAGTEEWKRYTINGADASFIEHSHAPLSIRATGYDSDAAVWEALRQNPDLAVIDSVALPGPTVQVGSAANFFLEGVQAGDTTMEPIQIEIGDFVSGRTRTVTIIGVIDPKVSMLYGLYMNDEAFDQVFAQPTQTMYYVQTQSGTDNVAFAKEIKAKLIAYGVQAESLEKLIEQGTAVSRGFLMLVEGFMALGLVVGIAALGVIAFRSVVERRQQIGMLRAIGYSRAMVGASFLIESTMITILGVGSGTILGLILSRNLMTSDEFTGSSGSAASFLVPWGTIALFVGIALVAGLVMAYIPARKAASVPIAEALRYE